MRADFYDWRQGARQLLEEPQHIDMAVVSVGINDDQNSGGRRRRIEPLTQQFNEIYARRIGELAKAFADKKTPLVWVGLPIMRSDRLSHAALQFNDMYREYGGAADAHFVDLWEAFANEGSKYNSFGPDVQGAIVRLRAADGVHFNKAGARKAAHFIESEIRRALEGVKPPVLPPAAIAVPAPDSPAGSTDANMEAARESGVGSPNAAPTEKMLEAPPAPPPKPLAGPITPLTATPSAPGAALATLSSTGKTSPQDAPPAPDQRPKPGRADDFSWVPIKRARRRPRRAGHNRLPCGGSCGDS